jgi:hypothetical protein
VITEERIPARPARVGVLQAARRYPLLVIVPAILLAGVGGALGYARDPTYTADAELAVGQLNVSNPAAVGVVVEATQTLASVYARLIDARGLKERVVRKVGKEAFGSSIAATPIPRSPLIRVIATADSPRVAVRVANAASDALRRYAQRYADTRKQTRATSKRVRDAELKVARQQDRVNRFTATYRGKPSIANRKRLNVAKADLEGVRLLRDSLRLNFQVSQQNIGSRGPVLRTFRDARGATSDRRSTTEILGLTGLIAGLAVGAAIATARLNRRVSRFTRP